MLLLTILLVICLIFGVIGFITENTGMLITGIVALIIFMCAIFGHGIFVGIPSWTCQQSAKAMNVEYKFDFFAGCLVKYHGNWYPINSRRVFE